MFESNALSRLNDALRAVVALGPTLDEMVAEIRSMREVMVETNRSLAEVTTAMDATRVELQKMSADMKDATAIIERAHTSLRAAADARDL